MSVSPVERELVTIGAAIASGCKTCIRENITVARSLHVTEREISNIIALAISIRRDATDNIEQFAVTGLDKTSSPEHAAGKPDQKRRETLVSVGAAFAVNCVYLLKSYLASARALGIPDDDIREVTGLSEFMKSLAASQVERLMCPTEYEDNTDMLANLNTPFGPDHCAWAHLCKPAAMRTSDSSA